MPTYRFGTVHYPGGDLNVPIRAAFASAPDAYGSFEVSPALARRLAALVLRHRALEMVESVPSELLTFITKARLRGQVSLLSLDSESKAAVPIPHAAVVSLDELAALGLDARTAERWSLRHAEDHAAELIGHAWEGGTVIVQRPASVGGGDGAAVIGTRRLALALDEADIAEGLRGHSPT